MKSFLCLLLLFPVFVHGQAWQWGRQGIGSDGYSNSAAVDANGDVYITGVFSGPYIVFGSDTIWNFSSSMIDDVFLVKYDALGNVKWARNSIGVGDAALSVTTDAYGGVYITGGFTFDTVIFGTALLTTGSNPNYATDMFLVKYDTSGNVRWAKTALTADTSFVYGTAVKTDAAGNVYVTGFFRSGGLIFGADTLRNTADTAYDVFLTKFDSAGNVVWAKQSKGGRSEDYANVVTTDVAGNVYIAGNNTSAYMIFGSDTLIDPSIYLAKYDRSGNLLLAEKLCDAAAKVSSIVCDASGNVIIGGSFTGTEVFDTDTLVGAPTVSPTGTSTLFLVKLDSAANVLWARDANGSCGLASLACDAAGNIFMTGELNDPWAPWSGGTITIGAYTLTTSGGYDILIAKYSGAGSVLWAASAGGARDDRGMAITVDASGNNIYVTGFFSSLDMQIRSDELHDGSTSSVFLAKFNPFLGEGVPSETLATKKISVFPNPATQELTISASSPINQVTITSIIGETVFTNAFNTENARVDISDMPAGVYFIKINGAEVRKFVKE